MTLNQPTERTRTPPHDVDAERSLLGAMLMSHDAAAAGSEVCTAGDFYVPAHGHVFSAMAALLDKERPIDAVTVCDELQRAGQLEAVGDRSIFISLLANTPSIAHARHYAEIVARHAVARKLLAAGQEITQAGYSGDLDRVEAIIDSLGAAVATTTTSSWEPIDLRELTLEQVEPELMQRADGQHLLYRGKVHSLNGEAEAGKSHLVQSVSANEIRADRHVVYIDFETDPASIKGRMLEHGATLDELSEYFHYIRPHDLMTPGARRRLEGLLHRVEPTLVVIDGVAEALVLEGLDENQARDVTAFLQSLPRLSAAAGAAVLMLDHPVKDRESQGRYARGSGAKLAGVDVAFKMTSVSSFAHGHDGHSRLEVVKDRYGLVRSLQVGKTVADVMLRSLPAGAVTIELLEPLAEDPTDPGLAGFRPAARRVLAALEGPFAIDPAGRDVQAIGDLVAVDGRGQPLKRRTIQAALQELKAADPPFVDLVKGLWRATRAQNSEDEDGMDA